MASPPGNISKRVSGAFEPVTALQKAIAGGREDIAAIAQGMKLLPALLETLSTIDKRVSSMEVEVKAMRRGVDELGKLQELRTDIQGINKPLEDLTQLLRPVKRVRHRLTRHDDELLDEVELVDSDERSGEPG